MSSYDSGAAMAPHRRGTSRPRKAPTAHRSRAGIPKKGTGRVAPKRRASKGTDRPATAKRRRPGGDDPRLRGQVDSAATMALILGLVGFLVIPLLGPFAIMKGNEAGRLARRARLPVPGTATAGLVLGWIATIGMILGVLAVVAIFGLVLAAAP